MPDAGTSQPPQFKTAEYKGQPGSEVCRFCRQPVVESYYRVNRSMACAACARQVADRIPQDNHAAFTRGLLFGIGGALVGLILYAAVGIITGWMIGYVALAVGWIVGRTMMMGSGGIGGRHYQIAAVLLTYAAVSLAAIPIGIAQASKTHRPRPAAQSQSLRVEGETTAPGSGSESQPQPGTVRRRPSLGRAIPILVLLGLASPFLELQDPFHGLIGLVILFVGIQFAWKMTRGVSIQIQGPFKVSANPTPAGS